MGRNLNGWFYKPRKVVAVTIRSWDLAVDNDGASEQRLLETGRGMLRIASPGTGSHPSAKKVLRLCGGRVGVNGLESVEGLSEKQVAQQYNILCVSS